MLAALQTHGIRTNSALQNYQRSDLNEWGEKEKLTHNSLVQKKKKKLITQLVRNSPSTQRIFVSTISTDTLMKVNSQSK
jgi:predicted DNA-binding ribbon-helix-helix protein